MKAWEKEENAHLYMEPTHQVGSGNAVVATSFSHRSRLMSGFQFYTTPRIALDSWLHALNTPTMQGSGWPGVNTIGRQMVVMPGCGSGIKQGRETVAKAPCNQQRGILLKGPTSCSGSDGKRAGGNSCVWFLKLKAYRQATGPQSDNFSDE